MKKTIVFTVLEVSNGLKSDDLFKEVIYQCNCKYGAPMGRGNIIPNGVPTWLEETSYWTAKEYIKRHYKGKVYDRIVPLNSGGYDKGGAYWGHGAMLRVAFSHDLTFILFYRS